MVAGILPGLFRRLRCRYPKLGNNILGIIPGAYSFIALSRRIAYYQPKPVKYIPSWHFPALGPFLLNWSFCLAVFLYCLSVRPWYRLNREWGSPPLAIRAGMLANGLFPILFALSTKVNVVTILTAISHERLQVNTNEGRTDPSELTGSLFYHPSCRQLYHQWIGRLLLLLTVIHFVPFIWQPLHEGGLEDLKSYWYSDPAYWNGR